MLLFYWPLSIRLLQNLSERPFSPKNQRRLFALLSINPSSMLLTPWQLFNCLLYVVFSNRVKIRYNAALRKPAHTTYRK